MIRRFAISEASMVPALRDGDYVLTTRLRNPQRGDIVVFEHPERNGFQLVKRVVGLPGEHLSITDGFVMIHGTVLDEPWTTTGTPGSVDLSIGEGSVFLLGDARSISVDSRRLGTIPIGSCRRVVWRYWPRFGPVG